MIAQIGQSLALKTPHMGLSGSTATFVYLRREVMDATQLISDLILESDEDESNDENENRRGQPLAKLCILKNEHIPQTELPLFLGDNVLGRDPNTCTLLLSAPSVSKQHATICLSVYRGRASNSTVDVEALVWDLGSMNGTRKGRLKLTPNVRYALGEGDRLVVADIACQYFSCNVDSPQGDMQSPVNRNSGVKANLPDASREKEGDIITSSKNCVNRGTEDKQSLKRTPAKASCLSFEQTPTHPQGTLVPESDSDSESEKWRAGDRRRKALASDSDSHKSSPTCSTFMSPANKIVPESEDESSVTPTSSTKNRTYNLSTKETDINLGRQQPNTKKALAVVDDSEEEEEGAAHRGMEFKESGQHVLVEKKSAVSITGEDELPVSTAMAFKDAIPVLSMDSDTDLEGEEEGVVSSGPVTLNTNQQCDQPPNNVQFHMDSDTDIEEDQDVSGKTFSNNETKPSPVISVTQPEGITMDSDTDVDDADTAAASKTKPTHMAEPATSMQLKDFHLDSDTDVDEDEEEDCGTKNKDSEMDETPNKLDIQPRVPQYAPADPQNLNLDSGTDDEAFTAPAINEPAVVPSCNTAVAGANLHASSDSDTDVEGDSPLLPPVAGTSLSVSSRPEALESNSDAATDEDESIMPPAGNAANPVHPKVNSDTDVDDKKGDNGGAGKEDQIPTLQREFTPALLAPLLQKCSTPVQLQEGEVEGMETQAFITPSTDAFRCAVAPAIRPAVLSSCSDSQEDEDFVVAETQSFILQTRDCLSSTEPTQAFVLDSSGDKKDEQFCREESFQLGLSDSSHLQCQDQALAMESTQAFVSVGRSVNLEDTQMYAAITAADRISVGNDSSPDATQPYGEDEEPNRCAMETGRENMAFEATQAYISETCSDKKDNTDEERHKPATTKSPTSSTLAMAETQQMCTSVSGESDDDDSFPGPQKRTTKLLKFEEEQTQPLACSVETQPMHVGVDETQPMAPSEDDVSSDADSVLVPPKRKSKQLHLEEEDTPQLSNSEMSVAETQPMSTCQDDEDSIPCIRKRKAKPLQLEEEQTQPLTGGCPIVETQPLAACDSEQSEEEDLIPCPRKRKAKALQFEEEQTQPLTSSETQQVMTGEHEESEDDGSSPGPSEKIAKHFQPAGKETLLQPPKRKGRSYATCTEEESSPVRPKRRTRAEDESLPSTRGRTRARPDDDDDVDDDNSEEDVKQTKRSRGKRTLKDQKDYGDQKFEKTMKKQRGINERKKKQEMEEEKLETERKEKEEQERLQAENAERMRLEEKRIERERKEKELLETAKREQEEMLKRKEKEERERQEREKLEREEKQRLEREEKQRIEREEKERLEREEKQRIDREEKERLEREEKQRIEREEKKKLEMERKKEEERLKREAKEREEREKLEKEKEAQEKERGNKNEENKQTNKEPTRGRRANRKTIAAPYTPEPDSSNHDIPARRTRSRSNSSNSVSSERSASSINTQESTGRGRGRGAKRISAPPQTTTTRSSQRRTLVAAGPAEDDDISPLSRSNSSTSLNSEISSCSVTSESRGRGGRQRGRGRKTEADSILPQSDHAPGPAVRSSRNRKTVGSSSEALQKDATVKPDSQQASTTRGRRQVTSVPADENDQSKQGDGCASENSPVPKRNVSSRGQKESRETTEEPEVGESAQDKRKGGKGELQANTEAHSSRNSNVSKEKENALKTEAAKVHHKDETKDGIPATAPAQRRGRVSSVQEKKNAREPLTVVEVKESEEMEVDMAEKKSRGRRSVVPKKSKKEELEDSGTSTTSINQDVNVQASQLPPTPTSSASRKRQAPAESFPVAKSPRSVSASPASRGRVRAAGQTHKVLFTGVVDEAGEKALTRLGGSIAKDVADMNCLVTDKVRRTVKFLCAVAKGVPIVTTDWLEKSGKAGSFLSPNDFLVKDPEQEKKFNFCLTESLGIASRQPLLQGYEIHITKSVKPDPVQMKDIISCSGATFLPKMPSCHKPQTVVISCEEDWLQCGPAISASLPIVNAEFILTGILQQKIDFQAHKLSAPAAKQQPAAGRGRSRKKT